MKEACGICQQTYIPVRAEPSEKAEMVSQILFGELFTIFEETKDKKFALIKLVNDGYEGWIDMKTIHPLESEEFAAFRKKQALVIQQPVRAGSPDEPGQTLWLSAGSLLYPEEGFFYAGNARYRIPDDAVVKDSGSRRDIITASCVFFMNMPYLWGGKSSFGTDCSGLVQNIYLQAGIRLPRDASQQALSGKTMSFISEAGAGDLAFFDNAEGAIVHTGIILDGNRIIHASGRVRTDRIDHQGIFSEEAGRYTHRLRVVKNVID